MNISVGILAYNEAAQISGTIDSFFSQSIFSAANQVPVNLEIICIPNGCTDNTASIVQQAFDRHVKEINNDLISCEVIEIAEAGKSNAWNKYVHDYSCKNADALLLMDADIIFNESDTLKNMVTKLLETPTADVVVDLQIKDICYKKKKSLFEKISLKMSDNAGSDSVAICGQLYLGRSKALRKVWMPKGLPGEDGFLRALITTDMFRQKQDLSRVVRAEHASHVYEACSSLKEMFHHELRMVLGTCLNAYLNWDFLLYATDPNGLGAGDLIKNRELKDPDWYTKLMKNQILNHGFWVLPRGMLFSSFTKIKYKGARNLFKDVPLSLIAFFFRLPIYLVANYKLKKGSAIGFW